MSLDYRTPDDISSDYLRILKSLKPDIDVANQDNDWWIRSKVVGGVVAGIYADQKKIANDAFPQSARTEALERHLNLYFNEGFEPATPSVGEVLASGATGSFMPAGTEMVYDPNGNSYQTTEDLTLDAATGVVPVRSVGTGQIQNLLEGTEMTLSTPPAGFEPTVTVVNKDLSDGRDPETPAQAVERILQRVRTPLAGGKESDYEQFALAADPSVVTANVIRHPLGLGTVGVVITAGTTDIDTAIDNGTPIVLIPSNELIELVKEYIETQNPLTDCVQVYEPIEVPIDVTVYAKFKTGDASTILTGQTLTQEELVQREVTRALYKHPVGGRKLGASGYVVASEIEESLDFYLSDSPYQVGTKAQILIDRKVDDLSATGFNRLLMGNEIPTPGTITVIEI